MKSFTNPFRRSRPIPKQGRVQGRFSTKSECIQNVTYDPATGTLVIDFHNPEIGKWEYYNVPVYEAAGIQTAASRGSYFNQFIKDHYEYERIG